MIYTKEYFIEKFKSIPDEKIFTDGDGSLFNKENPTVGCALYHCGVTEIRKKGNLEYVPTEEAIALADLLYNNFAKIANKNPLFKRTLKTLNDMAEGEKNNLWLVAVVNDLAPYHNNTPKQSILNCLEAI